jgi:tyrosyl-tRNA synthetase
MTFSEELAWRGFRNQTTIKDDTLLNEQSISFYFGVDPSADSMTVGHLAMAMMVKLFIKHGHKAYLLVGGATGMIGDPDGKANERQLKAVNEIAHNKAAIAAQYKTLFAEQPFTIVDNYDWFKDYNYLAFLREIGKHVPMRQMLGRDFVQSRLSQDGDGLSYAEFSYVLIQAYDFLHLHREYGVNLQVAGSDQWGNSIAGVDLIRRLTSDETHVWSAPLVINRATGVKFGKSEAGAIWLDNSKTSATQFYQFWINSDDQDVESYLKIFTELDQSTIAALMEQHAIKPEARQPQIRLAQEVTRLVHGAALTSLAELVTTFLTGAADLSKADEAVLTEIRHNIPAVGSEDNSIASALVASGLASSLRDARQLIAGNAISINGQKVKRDRFEDQDFHQGRLLLRRGKAFKDAALVERSN